MIDESETCMRMLQEDIRLHRIEMFAERLSAIHGTAPTHTTTRSDGATAPEDLTLPQPAVTVASSSRRHSTPLIIMTRKASSLPRRCPSAHDTIFASRLTRPSGAMVQPDGDDVHHGSSVQADGL